MENDAERPNEWCRTHLLIIRATAQHKPSFVNDPTTYPSRSDTIGIEVFSSFQKYADSSQIDAPECDLFPLALTSEDTWLNGKCNQ